MGKKILDSRALYAVLSVLIAVSLWFYVTASSDEPDSKPIHNIPVTFTGMDILEDRNLMIVGEPYTASIRVRATPMVLADLNDSTIQVTANVSGISAEGTHTLSFDVTLPAGVDRNQVEIITGLNGNVISVEVARFSRRDDIPIVGEFIGRAAEGYLAGGPDDFLFSPATITVSGQQELVNQIAYARVVIDETDLTETVSGEFPFQLIDPSGNVLKDLDVTCDVETVYTTFPILATAEIPLQVNFIDGGGVAASEASCQLSTDSIKVAGSKDAVEALEAAGAINLATIDLSTVRDGDELTLPVPLADELTNITGVTEVKAVIYLNKRLVSQTFEVTNITCINPPEGWTAEVITQVLPVEVRGQETLMREITAENLRVVADLETINPAAGQYTVSVYVYLDSVPSAAEIGVMSSDYRVVVNLLEGAPEPVSESENVG